jgi:hypothetical protein
MKWVIYMIALLIGATTMAQTIIVNGIPILVSDDISFPFWLESGSSISPEVPVSSISVLEFNIVPNNNGNDMVFNQVISVTEAQTVPEGKAWKVESVLVENQGFEEGTTNSSLFIPTNSYGINITIESPIYDSAFTGWVLNASILPSGGSPITERGFCYSSTNQLPTVYDNITANGNGRGSFEDFIYIGDNMLEPSTTYYIRSYATSLEGITYSDVYDFTTTPPIVPVIGDFIHGGIVFYVDETGLHGLVAAFEDLPDTYHWGCVGINLPGADGTAIGTGYQNTLDIVAGCSETPIAASEALAYVNKFNDWYLPSIDELVEMFNTLGFGDSNDNIGGFDVSMWYSSSSESNLNASWYINCSTGNSSSGGGKDADFATRPIRSF